MRSRAVRGGWRRAAPRAVLLAVLVVAALAVPAAPAVAHAMLVEAVPADRSALDGPPAEVRLTFNEPVHAAAGAVRVFDREARRVDLGQRGVSDPVSVVVALPDGLPDGGYVVTYRVVSADSHPVAGVLTFTVGDAEEVDDALVAELFGGADRTVVGVLGPALRGTGYVAGLLAAGAALSALLVARRDEERAAARRLGVPAAVAGAVLALLAVPVQAVAVTGAGPVQALSPTVLREVAASSFGMGTAVRAAGLLALAGVWRPRRDRSGRALAWPALAAAVSLGSYLLDGHQRSMRPAAVLVAGDALHLAAGAVWVGGLALLVVALRRAAGGDDPALAATVARFSTVAAASVALLTVGGAAMAAVLVRAPAALTTTGYGWTLVAKTSAVAAVLAVAAYNRTRLVPAIARGGDGAARRLRRTASVEAAVLAGVLLLTGALVTQQPAAVAAGLTGSYHASAPLTDELEVDLVVDPNRAGRNTLHLYVLDPTGRPAATVEDLRLELTFVPQAIGPIGLELLHAGPGHWTGTIDELAFPGTWEVRVVVGLDRFSEASVTLTVPVAP